MFHRQKWSKVHGIFTHGYFRQSRLSGVKGVIKRTLAGSSPPQRFLIFSISKSFLTFQSVGFLQDFKSEKCIQDVIHNDARILKDPETAILVKELAESKVVFQVRSWVKGTDYWGVYFDVIEAVKKRFNAQGISIPVPQRAVHVYKHRKG